MPDDRPIMKYAIDRVTSKKYAIDRTTPKKYPIDRVTPKEERPPIVERDREEVAMKIINATREPIGERRSWRCRHGIHKKIIRYNRYGEPVMIECERCGTLFKLTLDRY